MKGIEGERVPGKRLEETVDWMVFVAGGWETNVRLEDEEARDFSEPRERDRGLEKAGIGRGELSGRGI